MMKKFESSVIVIHFNNLDIPADCVVFLLASWSTEQVYLPILIRSMEKYSPNVPLFVFDIDSGEYVVFQKKYNVFSNGKGEIYFIKEGKIQKDILQHNKTIEVANSQIVEIIQLYYTK